MIDTLKVFDILKAGGVPELQAKALAQTLRKADLNAGLDIKSTLEGELLKWRAIAEEQSRPREQRSDALSSG